LPSISRPLITNALARFRPMTRGSVYSTPQSGTSPTRTNDRQKRARAVATIMSAISAMPKPPP